MNKLILIIILLKVYPCWFSALAEEIESSHKALKFQVGDRVRMTKYKNIFKKDCTESLSKEIYVTDFLLKTNPWTYKIKDLNRETITESFYGQELLLSKLYIIKKQIVTSK